MIAVRPAHRDDAATLAMIGLRAWEHASSFIGVTDELRENARSAFSNFVGNSWHAITVVALDSDVVGWAARENLDEKITDFWIDPSCHRQGLGTILLKDVEQRIVENGYTAAHLESHAQNEKAISFFQRHGYGVCWFSMKYSPRLDRDVQSIGLRKQLVETEVESYRPAY